MKIWIRNKKTNEEEYVNVNFWSLLKANFLTSLVLGLMVYGGLFLLGTLFILFE